MLYEIVDGELNARDWGDYSYKRDVRSNVLIVSMVHAKQMEEVADFFDLPEQAKENSSQIATRFRSELQMYEGALFGEITLVDVQNMNDSRMQMTLVLRDNLLLLIRTVDVDGKLKQTMKQTMKSFVPIKQATNFSHMNQILFSLLGQFLDAGYEAVEHMEQQIVEVEHELVDNRVKEQVNKDIFLMKKCLYVWRRFYEEMGDVGLRIGEWQDQRLRENNCQKEMEKEGKRVALLQRFVERTQRLCEETKGLKEELIHLREALDATLEYNLNRIMKVFTAVTTICFPLSLIAGWYGMNFSHMPELTWKYGYVYVCILGILVVGGCVWYYRRKKWF